jgi:hypothetical protein
MRHNGPYGYHHNKCEIQVFDGIPPLGRQSWSRKSWHVLKHACGNIRGIEDIFYAVFEDFRERGCFHAASCNSCGRKVLIFLSSSRLRSVVLCTGWFRAPQTKDLALIEIYDGYQKKNILNHLSSPSAEFVTFIVLFLS